MIFEKKYCFVILINSCEIPKQRDILAPRCDIVYLKLVPTPRALDM